MRAESYVENLLKIYLKEKNLKNIEIHLDKPKHKNFGDLSTNLALQLASFLKSSPRQIAEEIKNTLAFDKSIIEKIEIIHHIKNVREAISPLHPSM